METVYAINNLYSALGSPPLSGWTTLGGDPCYELWQGVQCTNNNITAMYYYFTKLMPYEQTPIAFFFTHAHFFINTETHRAIYFTYYCIKFIPFESKM